MELLNCIKKTLKYELDIIVNNELKTQEFDLYPSKFKNYFINNDNFVLDLGTVDHEIINDNMLDIIAYCEVKHCYPKVLELFRKEYANKFDKYNENKVKNNIAECNTDSLEDITKPKHILFSTIGLSGLKMKAPGEFA